MATKNAISSAPVRRPAAKSKAAAPAATAIPPALVAASVTVMRGLVAQLGAAEKVLAELQKYAVEADRAAR